MHRVLRSIGILLIVIGVCSFVMPKFKKDFAFLQALGDPPVYKRDSIFPQNLGSFRSVAMILSILTGAGLSALSYRMQMAMQREAAARRRAAQEEAARRKVEIARDEETEEAVSNELPESAVSASETFPEAAPPVSTADDWKLPEAPANEPTPVQAGSVIVSTKSSETPQVVAEYVPVAEEKVGSESVVIEKTAVDPAPGG